MQTAPGLRGAHREIGCRLPFVLAVPLLLSACVTQGIGRGETPAGVSAARFSWRATDATEGTMTAVLADGTLYSGPFFQITRESEIEDFAPLWDGWRGFRARGWPYWGPTSTFVTHYSGRVVANLTGPNGHMRCRFILRRPHAGMAGGGEGRCQLPDKSQIEAQFDRG